MGGRGQLYSLSHGTPSLPPKGALVDRRDGAALQKITFLYFGQGSCFPPSDVAARQGSPPSNHLISARAPRAVGCRPALASGTHTSLILCGI